MFTVSKVTVAENLIDTINRATSTGVPVLDSLPYCGDVVDDSEDIKGKFFIVYLNKESGYQTCIVSVVEEYGALIARAFDLSKPGKPIIELYRDLETRRYKQSTVSDASFSSCITAMSKIMDSVAEHLSERRGCDGVRKEALQFC